MSDNNQVFISEPLTADTRRRWEFTLVANRVHLTGMVREHLGTDGWWHIEGAWSSYQVVLVGPWIGREIPPRDVLNAALAKFRNVISLAPDIRGEAGNG